MADHLGFVAAAYAVTAVLLLGTVVWVVMEYALERRSLDAWEKSGRAERGSQGRS